jgi:hypothetical protein
MSLRKLNINDLIEKQYGFRASPFELPEPSRQEELTRRTASEIFREVNGVPYYLPVTLDGVFIQHCVMSINAQKRIVETPMVNRRGSVKELISVDDYRIQLDGFLHRADGTFPDTEIEQLVLIFERNESIQLRSALSDYFLIEEDKVVIKSLEFPSMKGIVNVKNFRMSLVSDSIFDLEL